MNFNNVVIESLDYHLPDLIMSSSEIEDRLAPIYKRIKLPEGRLELMTGISERRYWERGTLPSDISTSAARKLMDKHKIKPDEIDLLIHSSVCRDFLEPSTASVIHSNLELQDECMFFDLSNACLGMLNSFVMAANIIEAGTIKRALIVSGENGGPLLLDTIDHLNQNESITRKTIKKYIANLTIGSAGVAYTLTHKDHCKTAGHKLLGGAVMSDTTANHLCKGDGNANSLMMETDSEKLLEHGIRLAKKTFSKTLLNLDTNIESIDWALGHQVGKAHEELTMKAMGLENHKTWTTYKTLGNTGSAALPITLVDLEKQNKLKNKDMVMLLGIGSGLSSLMLGVQW